VNYDAIREAKKSKEISLEHCNSENQIADIMAKALSKGKFEEFWSKFEVANCGLSFAWSKLQ